MNLATMHENDVQTARDNRLRRGVTYLIHQLVRYVAGRAMGRGHTAGE